jgi:hypothetical protein
MIEAMRRYQENFATVRTPVNVVDIRAEMMRKHLAARPPVTTCPANAVDIRAEMMRRYRENMRRK